MASVADVTPQAKQGFRLSSDHLMSLLRTCTPPQWYLRFLSWGYWTSPGSLSGGKGVLDGKGGVYERVS